MTTAQNKRIVREHFEEIWTKGNLDAVERTIAPDMISHDPRGPEPGQEAFKDFVNATRSAFPDIGVTVGDMVAEGDVVAARATFTATHQGEFQGIPPTGKQITVNLQGFFRIADDKIAEAWVIRDDLGTMQQLGAIPSPEEAQA